MSKLATINDSVKALADSATKLNARLDERMKARADSEADEQSKFSLNRANFHIRAAGYHGAMAKNHPVEEKGAQHASAALHHSEAASHYLNHHLNPEGSAGRKHYSNAYKSSSKAFSLESKHSLPTEHAG